MISYNIFTTLTPSLDITLGIIIEKKWITYKTKQKTNNRIIIKKIYTQEPLSKSNDKTFDSLLV